MGAVPPAISITHVTVRAGPQVRACPHRALATVTRVRTATVLTEETHMRPEHACASNPSSQFVSGPDRTPSPPPLVTQSSRSFTVELACLRCVRTLGMLESDTWPTYRPAILHRAGAAGTQVADWRRLRCTTCGGAAIPADVTCWLVRSEARSTGRQSDPAGVAGHGFLPGSAAAIRRRPDGRGGTSGDLPHGQRDRRGLPAELSRRTHLSGQWACSRGQVEPGLDRSSPGGSHPAGAVHHRP
jgi:hypothetical protein